MKAKDWFQIIWVSALTLLVVYSVGYGAWCLFIDTGRAILHP